MNRASLHPELRSRVAGRGSPMLSDAPAIASPFGNEREGFQRFGRITLLLTTAIVIPALLLISVTPSVVDDLE